MNIFPETAGLQPASPESQHSNLYRRLLRDFYLSFHFSQGNQVHQELIVQTLDMDYRSSMPEPNKQHLPKLLPQLKAGALRLMPPKAHRPVKDSERAIILGIEWTKFGLMLGSLASKAPEGEDAWRGKLGNLAWNMVARDYAFCHPRQINSEPGRPNRTAGQDPYESHFREYVLRGKQTGSESFDRIFSHIHTLYMDETRPIELPVFFSGLQKIWELHHPSETFIPQ
jgi:hypothetical protein